MAAYVQDAPRPDLPAGVEQPTGAAIEALKTRDNGENVADIREELQVEMMEKASVFRTDDSLCSMAATIDDLRKRYASVAVHDKGSTFNYELTEALELGFLLDLAETLVASARARTESRGGHFRDDFPKRNDVEWMRHTLVRREGDGKLSLDYKPVVGGKYEPMERKY